MLRLLACAAIVIAPTAAVFPASASEPAKWCWSMQSGSLKGTFTTDGSLPGNGTAAAGTYNLTGFTVYESDFPEIEIGSIANGTYAFGAQPNYQIVWNGAAVTGFYRSSGALTNGLGIFNGPGGTGAYIIFGINYESADTQAAGGTNIFTAIVTPALTPVPATGQCENEAPRASHGQSLAEGPLDVLEQYGRTVTESCQDGWSPSWALWPNDRTGGWVCTRTLYYDITTRSWQVR